MAEFGELQVEAMRAAMTAPKAIRPLYRMIALLSARCAALDGRSASINGRLIQFNKVKAAQGRFRQDGTDSKQAPDQVFTAD